MEEAICGGVKTWQPSSILSNERQAIKRQAAQNGCMYATICALPPLRYVAFFGPLLLVTGALTVAAKFISGQEWLLGRGVTPVSPLGAPAPSKAWVCVSGGWLGGAGWGGGGWA